MTCLADRQYDLKYFHQISPSVNADNTINAETVAIINTLASRVGAPEYQRTPVFKKRGHDGGRRPRPQRAVITADDWQEMRNFKSQKLHKNEDGIEKEIDDLRMLLNKLTETNYQEMRDKIVVALTKILESEPEEADLMKVGVSIFEIGCLNKFWAKLYAQLYKDLIGTFPIMNSIYKKNFESFLSLFDVIRFISAEEDYDKFCEVNKENEKRRSISSFFVHLMKNNVLSQDKIMNIINILKSKFQICIEENNMRNEVNEIGANLCILIREGRDTLNGNDDWPAVEKFVEDVSDMNHKDHISLTSKVVFMFMDLSDD